jgi:CRP-like cAMP-binding protein
MRIGITAGDIGVQHSWWITSLNSSEKRLARLLLLLANFGQESKPIPITAKVSQETLAEMIGTTRSRVSFFMNRFRDLGFIDYNGGGMHVHSSLRGASRLNRRYRLRIGCTCPAGAARC